MTHGPARIRARCASVLLLAWLLRPIGAHAEPPAERAEARRPAPSLWSVPATAHGFPSLPSQQAAQHAAAHVLHQARMAVIAQHDSAPAVTAAVVARADASARGATMRAPWPNFAEPAARHRPVRGRVVARFGPRWSAVSGTNVRNAGWTWEVAAEAPITALGRGVVTRIEPVAGFGHVVVIDHAAGYHSVYLGVRDALVQRGDVVDLGTEIGLGGVRSSFDALEVTIEVRHAGVPIDPSPWLRP